MPARNPHDSRSITEIPRVPIVATLRMLSRGRQRSPPPFRRL
jgi:hypothetical protein